MKIAILTVLLSLAAIGPHVPAYTESGDDPETWWAKGYLIDEERYSSIVLPDSMLLCRYSEGGLRCMKVPSGTILLLSTPPDSL